MTTKRLCLLILFLLFLKLTVFAQSSTNTATRVRNGTADPSTCTTTGSNIFYRTDTGSLKVCTAANTWTAAGSSLAPAGSGSELQYRASASTLGAVTGSSVSGGAVTLTAMLTARIQDGDNDTIPDVLKLLHVGVDTPAANFGVGLLWKGSDDLTNEDDMARTSAIWTDATSGSEDSAFTVQLRTAGAALAEKFRGTSTGIWQSTGLQASNLTSTRVPIIGASGLLGDDADLTFATDTLTATKLIASTNIIIAGGTAITGHLSATATLNFASQVGVGCENLTIAVTGAAVGDSVVLGIPDASIVTNGVFYAWVSATDVVSVKFCAVVSGDPASGSFRVDVWKH